MSNPKDEVTTPPVVNDGLPVGVTKNLAKQIKHTFGKGTVQCSNGELHTIFNYTPGALICRNCTAINLPDAVICQECGMSHEIAVYVGLVE